MQGLPLLRIQPHGSPCLDEHEVISVQPSTQYELSAKETRRPPDREVDSGSTKYASFAYRSTHRKKVAADPLIRGTSTWKHQRDIGYTLHPPGTQSRDGFGHGCVWLIIQHPYGLDDSGRRGTIQVDTLRT